MRNTILVALTLLLWPVYGHTTTIRVPSQQPSIREGIDAAVSGDTVLVAPGFYSGYWNRDIIFWGKEIVLISECGPSETIIDCGQERRAFYLAHGEGPATIIDGFTISRGESAAGGGIRLYGASPTIRNCIFFGCHVEYNGGHSESMTFGGAIDAYASHSTITNCTFMGNSLGPAQLRLGTAIHALAGGVTIENCLFSQNSAVGPEIYVGAGSSSVQHCISDQDNAHPEGNMWGVNPAMCSGPMLVFHPCSDSPALPEHNEWGELVGALPSGCGPCNTEVRESTWGSVKALFR